MALRLSVMTQEHSAEDSEISKEKYEICLSCRGSKHAAKLSCKASRLPSSRSEIDALRESCDVAGA